MVINELSGKSPIAIPIIIVLREVNAEKLKEQEVTENISGCSGEP